jgi:hypothetical protein
MRQKKILPKGGFDRKIIFGVGVKPIFVTPIILFLKTFKKGKHAYPTGPYFSEATKGEGPKIRQIF